MGSLRNVVGFYTGRGKSSKTETVLCFHAINASVVIELGSASEVRLHTNQNF